MNNHILKKCVALLVNMRVEFHTGKKLNQKEDIEELLAQLKPETKELSLQGNSLSVEVSELIGRALDLDLTVLDIHDCFTGRFKLDVPISIDHLLRNCPNLTQIDLRDNALSVKGALHFSNYLQDSKLVLINLTNTGIGIDGVKHISDGLKKYCEHHKNPPLLEFECGRNRLESGSKYLAHELSKCVNLKVLRLYQNGIRPDFIKLLSFELRTLKNLVHLDLQDNSFMFSGSEAFANELLPALSLLEMLNVGECLTKEKGGILILKSLKCNNKRIKEVNMTYNELNTGSLEQIVDNKDFWDDKTILLNGNVFDPDCELALRLLDCTKTDVWDDMELPDSEDEDEE
eukprot:NODE_955_length_2789_cov_0.219703.p1 type:complete len:345 gc:universal NODE_955_length_2789_cov_0.219703:406-1440(+)